VVDGLLVEFVDDCGVVSGMVDGVLIGSSVLGLVVVVGEVVDGVVLGDWAAGRFGSGVVDGLDCAKAYMPNASRNVPVSISFLIKSSWGFIL